jgi:tight adherence protein B
MPNGLPPEIAGLLALMFVALGLLAWRMMLILHGSRAKIRRRLASMTDKSVDLSDKKRGALPKRKSVQARLKVVEGARNQARGYKMRELLRLAGLTIELPHYLIGSGALASLLLAAIKLFGLSWAAAISGALIFGIGLPKFIVGSMAKRRVGRFGAQFADAIDVIVRGIRSGLPLGECMNIIGREMPDPMGAEFRQIIEAQKLGMPLQDAVARMVMRMPINDLRYFAIVIAIQQQTGGNLAETLAKLSEVLRARKRMRDKCHAFASEARASAMIIGSLPMVVILALAALAPQYISLLFTTDTGNAILLIGALTEISGLWVMHKMINFDL